MPTIFSVFLLTFKTTFRNLKSSGIVFILPIVFMILFGIAFGGENTVEFTVGVFTKDVLQPVSEINLEEVFKGVSEDSKENTSQIQINYQTFSEEESLLQALEKEEIEIGLVFSQATLTSQQENKNQQTNIEPPNFQILLPGEDLNSVIYRSILTDIFSQVLFDQQFPIESKVAFETRANLTGFDLLAPGLIIYGLIILIPSIANDLTEISEKKYIFRYATSKVKAYEILLGNMLFYFFIGSIQTLLLYFVARFFGYASNGSILVALVPALLTLLFIIAVGLLIGSLFQKTAGATNLGSILSIVLGFFSGSFISGIGNLLEFQLFGKTFQLNDLLPTKWGTVAVEKILTKNQSLFDIQTELLVLAISGFLTILLGIWLYSGRQLKKVI